MSKLWCFSVQEYTKVHKLHNPFPQKYLLICIHFEFGFILNLEQIFRSSLLSYQRHLFLLVSFQITLTLICRVAPKLMAFIRQLQVTQTLIDFKSRNKYAY